jgi:hypothetical protein
MLADAPDFEQRLSGWLCLAAQLRHLLTLPAGKKGAAASSGGARLSS